MRLATRVFYGLFAGLLFTFNPSMSYAGNISEAVPAPTAAQQFATLSINTTDISSLPFTGGNKHFTITYARSSGDFPTSLAADIRTEPYIFYHLTATNNSLSDEFLQLAIGTYIGLQGMCVEIQNDLTVITSGIGPISITPTYDGVNPSAGFQRDLLSTNGGLSFDSAGEYGPLGTTITSAGTTVFPTFLQRNNSAPNYDYMELLVGFNLSAGTTVTLDGRIEINAVPEPSTLMMASMAVFMFVGCKLRSRIKPRVS